MGSLMGGGGGGYGGYGSIGGNSSGKPPPQPGEVRSIAPARPSYSAPSAPVSAPMPAANRNPVGPAASPRPMPQYQPPRAPAPSTTQYKMPAYQAPPPPRQYQSYDPQSSPVAGDLRELSGKGSDLMDPNSDYYKELVAQMRGDIGKSTAASKRSAALEGAEQGFGAGASPEMMSNMENIGEAGRIAEGEAMGDLTLAAPRLGASMMSSTFGPGVGLEGIGEQSGQYGHGAYESGVMNRAGLAEGARGTDVGAGLSTMQMANDRAQREAEMRNQWEQWEAEFGLREDAFAADYGYDGGGGGGGGIAGANY